MNGGPIQRVVTHGTFELDGGSWEVDNNIWVVSDDAEVVVFDAAHDAGSTTGSQRLRSWGSPFVPVPLPRRPRAF